jgi:hypothetical protein
VLDLLTLDELCAHLITLVTRFGENLRNAADDVGVVGDRELHDQLKFLVSDLDHIVTVSEVIRSRPEFQKPFLVSIQRGPGKSHQRAPQP